MVDDRLYRMLIPGTVFLFALVGWLVADPSISLLTMLQTFGLPGTSSLSILALGGSLTVVVIGYMIGEVGFSREWPKPTVSLCPGQEEELGRRLREAGIASADLHTRLTVYSHMLLGKEHIALVGYLSRAWSRAIIAVYSQLSIVLAFLAFAILRIVLHMLYHESTPYKWLESNFSIATLVRFSVYLAVNIFILYILDRSRSVQQHHRQLMYQAILAMTPNVNVASTTQNSAGNTDGVAIDGR